jgi:ABC-type transporter Mla MlaB component
VILRLEGKLIGPWVSELKACCAIVCQEGHRLSLDMTDVVFADRTGLALLRSLQESHVVLAGCPALISAELDR